MNRIDRLHAILVHLQSKKKVTAAELAERFGLSLRTVYRDVKALDESGVPIIGEAGIGYSVMEGYRLPPVMFTQEEASAILLSTKLAERFTDTAIKKQLDSALFKIKSVLRSDDKEHLEELQSSIAVLRPQLKEYDEDDTRWLLPLQKALAAKQVVSLNYFSSYKEENTSRQVQPIGLCYYSNCWHLIAWCMLRKNYRDFKLKSISRLQLEDTIFETTKLQSLDEYMTGVMSKYDLVAATLLVDKKIKPHIAEQKYYYGYISETDAGEWVRMEFMTSSLWGLARWLLMFTNSVRIEGPQELTRLMQRFTTELTGIYEPVTVDAPCIAK